MNADRWSSLHKALLPALLGAFLAGAAIGSVAVPLLSTSPAASSPRVENGPPVTAPAPTEPMLETPTDEDCSSGRVVEPGEYESIERSRGASATWVIIPESYEEIAPAPLYVLSVAPVGIMEISGRKPTNLPARSVTGVLPITKGCWVWLETCWASTARLLVSALSC